MLSPHSLPNYLRIIGYNLENNSNEVLFILLKLNLPRFYVLTPQTVYEAYDYSGVLVCKFKRNGFPKVTITPVLRLRQKEC